jgi:transposase-like protein
MIDKDLNEQKVLSEAFQQARIFYCKFHVIQIFKRKFERSSRELYEILVKMIDAATEDEFNKLLADFTPLASEVVIKDSKTAKTALEYFNDNWRNCVKMWVKCFKYPACTHMNDTNNPIESINNVLKLFIPNAGSMCSFNSNQTIHFVS